MKFYKFLLIGFIFLLCVNIAYSAVFIKGNTGTNINTTNYTYYSDEIYINKVDFNNFTFSETKLNNTINLYTDNQLSGIRTDYLNRSKNEIIYGNYSFMGLPIFWKGVMITNYSESNFNGTIILYDLLGQPVIILNGSNPVLATYLGNITAHNILYGSNYTQLINQIDTNITNHQDNFKHGNTSTEIISAVNGQVNSTSWNRTGTNVVLANVNDNVGIGTSIPNQKLHVNGTVNITNDLYLNNNSNIVISNQTAHFIRSKDSARFGFYTNSYFTWNFGATSPSNVGTESIFAGFGVFGPSTNNIFKLGDSARRWNDSWFSQITINQTSINPYGFRVLNPVSSGIVFDVEGNNRTIGINTGQQNYPYAYQSQREKLFVNGSQRITFEQITRINTTLTESLPSPFVLYNNYMIVFYNQSTNITVWDTSSEKLRFIDKFNYSRYSITGTKPLWAEVRNNYLFLLTNESFNILSIKQPLNWTLISTTDTSKLVGGSTYCNGASSCRQSDKMMAITGKYAFISSGQGNNNNNISVWDISDYSLPKYVNSIVDNTYLEDVKSLIANSHYLYTYEGEFATPNNICAINIDDPYTDFTIKGCIAWAGTYPYGMDCQNNFCYIGTGQYQSSFTVIDFTNVTSPKFASNESVDGLPCARVKVSGRYAYCGSLYNSQLWVFDITNPSNISKIYTYTTPYSSNTQIDVQGKYLYILHGEQSAIGKYEIPSIFTPGLDVSSAKIGTLDVTQKINAHDDVNIHGALTAGETATISHGINVVENNAKTFINGESTINNLTATNKLLKTINLTPVTPTSLLTSQDIDQGYASDQTVAYRIYAGETMNGIPTISANYDIAPITITDDDNYVSLYWNAVTRANIYYLVRNVDGGGWDTANIGITTETAFNDFNDAYNEWSGGDLPDYASTAIKTYELYKLNVTNNLVYAIEEGHIITDSLVSRGGIKSNSNNVTTNGIYPNSGGGITVYGNITTNDYNSGCFHGDKNFGISGVSGGGVFFTELRMYGDNTLNRAIRMKDMNTGRIMQECTIVSGRTTCGINTVTPNLEFTVNGSVNITNLTNNAELRINNFIITSNGTQGINYIESNRTGINKKVNISSTIDVNGSMSHNFVYINTGTTSYNAGENDFLMIANNTASVVTVNLPSLESSRGRVYYFKVKQQSFTIDASGTEKIDGYETATCGTGCMLMNIGDMWTMILQYGYI